MQSKTSFFNKTVLKKDITRYAPIWAVYTIFLLLGLFEFGSYDPAITADNTLESVRAMTWINAIYAGVCAAFLFMDLFNGRLCNALHAFPLRREGWLCTHILSGFLFSFVPNLLATLVALPILWEYAYIAPIWLAGVTLQYLFFFGSAVLCAVCAGNLIGMAGLYGIFHLITVLIAGLAELFYQPLLHGVELTIDAFSRFIPLYQLNGFRYAEFEVIHDTIDPFGIFRGLMGKDWLYLGLCAAAGIVCIGLAWAVYRKRQLEAAGDLLSLKKLSPLFLLICTVGAGAVLYLLSSAFSAGSYVFLAVGAVVGYFAGRMLLGRTVKVFTKRALLGLGMILVVMGGTFLLTWLDPLGVTRYVPPLNKIESAAVIGADKGYYFYPTHSSMISYTGELNDTANFKITDKNELAELQDFHRQLIQYRPGPRVEDQPSAKVTISYTLDTGRVVSRHYKVETDSELFQQAGKYYNDIRYVFEVNDPKILYEAFESVTIEGYTMEKSYSIKLTDKDEIGGLIDAIQKDCDAGRMAQNWVFHDKYDENYYLDFLIGDKALQDAWGRSRRHLRVWNNSTNTTAYLQQMIEKHPEE